MKSAICFVESPLQLLCLDEFVNFRKVGDLKVIVRANPRRPKNERQLRNMLSRRLVFSDIPNLSYIFINNQESVLTVLSDYRIYKCIFAKESFNWDYAVIGDLRIPWMRRYSQSVRYSSLVCLDDGMASFLVRDEIIKKNNFKYREQLESFYIRAIIRTIVGKIYSLSYRKKIEKKDLLLYSSFIEPHEVDVPVERNEFLNLRKKNRRKSKVKEAWYYGSPLSEAGIVSVDRELDLLIAAKVFYTNSGLDILYFAHRDDSEDKLQAIKGVGLSVVKSEIPAEIFVTQSEKMPMAIAASGSSIFFTLDKILEDIKFTNFCFDPEFISLNHRKHRMRIDETIQKKLDVEEIRPLR